MSVSMPAGRPKGVPRSKTPAAQRRADRIKFLAEKDRIQRTGRPARDRYKRAQWVLRNKLHEVFGGNSIRLALGHLRYLTPGQLLRVKDFAARRMASLTPEEKARAMRNMYLLIASASNLQWDAIVRFDPADRIVPPPKV